MYSSVKSYQFILLISIIQFGLFSFPFLKAIWEHGGSPTLILLVSINAIITINAILTFLLFRLTVKWLVPLLFITSGVALYFINNYGITIDQAMISNVIETDLGEASELISVKLFLYVMLLGLLPSYCLSKIQINYQSSLKEFVYKILTIIISIILMLVIVTASYKTLVTFAKLNKNLQHALIPTNYLLGIAGLGLNRYKQYTNSNEFIDIAPEATQGQNSNLLGKKLVIMVVGEAARAKNFNLNGYERDTNEPLQYEVINYSNFASCGTSTFISVPCMFSHLGRKEFDINTAKNYSNILDILFNLHINVAWIDNNGGCKGVCARIPQYQSIDCNHQECYDELMLSEIEKNILDDRDNLIILHQRGSHGPAYYQRVPEKFRRFTPSCDSKDFTHCTQEELVNAYDNTIYYTSYFLNEVISLLDKYSTRFSTALIYASDHGESLGEFGIYLHGAPYIIAPREQTHIPALIWLSRIFVSEYMIDAKCMLPNQEEESSHDNIAHTLLGIFNVQANIYDKKLDLLYKCKKSH